MSDPVTRHTTVGAIDLAWTEIGAGPPVLMLHGFPDIATTFVPVAKRLRDRGYRCVLPWARGYWPSAAPEHYDIGSLVADALGLIRELELERPFVVGTTGAPTSPTASRPHDPARSPRSSLWPPRTTSRSVPTAWTASTSCADRSMNGSSRCPSSPTTFSRRTTSRSSGACGRNGHPNGRLPKIISRQSSSQCAVAEPPVRSTTTARCSTCACMIPPWPTCARTRSARSSRRRYSLEVIGTGASTQPWLLAPRTLSSGRTNGRF